MHSTLLSLVSAPQLAAKWNIKLISQNQSKSTKKFIVTTIFTSEQYENQKIIKVMSYYYFGHPIKKIVLGGCVNSDRVNAEVWMAYTILGGGGGGGIRTRKCC